MTETDLKEILDRLWAARGTERALQIAFLRNDAPALIAEVRRLQEEVKRLTFRVNEQEEKLGLVWVPSEVK